MIMIIISLIRQVGSREKYK